jgi:hypothetical protein
MTMLKGTEVPSWFDIFKMDGTSEYDSYDGDITQNMNQDHIKESSDMLISLI